MAWGDLIRPFCFESIAEILDNAGREEEMEKRMRCYLNGREPEPLKLKDSHVERYVEECKSIPEGYSPVFLMKVPLNDSHGRKQRISVKFNYVEIFSQTRTNLPYISFAYHGGIYLVNIDLPVEKLRGEDIEQEYRKIVHLPLGCVKGSSKKNNVFELRYDEDRSKLADIFSASAELISFARIVNFLISDNLNTENLFNKRYGISRKWWSVNGPRYVAAIEKILDVFWNDFERERRKIELAKILDKCIGVSRKGDFVYYLDALARAVFILEKLSYNTNFTRINEGCLKSFEEKSNFKKSVEKVLSEIENTELSDNFEEFEKYFQN